jgi:hypothetical protein
MLSGHSVRTGVRTASPSTPATRQVVDLLGYGSPRWISNVLSVLLSGFVVAAVVRSVKVLGALQRTETSELGALTASGPFIFQMTMVLLCPLLLRTSQNLRAFGEAPDTGPVRLIGICLVPITNLFLPYFALKDIWMSTGRGSTAPPRWLPLWWWALVIQALAPSVLLRTAAEGSHLAPTLAAILAGPCSIVTFALTILVVRGLASDQTARYESLPPSLAPSRV